jgi:hypothetical protein
MPKYLEWDFDNPKHRQRRRPQPPPIDGEVLEPEPTPRIRVEVVHRAYQPRQRQHMPRLAIALLIIAAVMWISPFGLIVGLFLISVFLMMHPAVAIVLGVTIALVIGVAIRERRRGRPF